MSKVSFTVRGSYQKSEKVTVGDIMNRRNLDVLALSETKYKTNEDIVCGKLKIRSEGDRTC